MKKITLIATAALATATIAIGAKVNADTTVPVTVTEGTSNVDIKSDKSSLAFDFTALTFADGTGSLASQDLTITSTLSNKSFGTQQVTLSVSTPGTEVAPGLTAELAGGNTITADQATEKTQESTVTVDLDAKAFDSTKITEDSNPYVVTVKASDVTPVTPEG
jgi:hypothetical protein